MSRSSICVMACDGAQFVKIGIAQNVDKRLSQVQNGCPFRLAIAYQTGQTKTEIARQVEFRAHTILAKSRMQGEWFAIDADTAIAAVEDAYRFVRNRRGNLAYHPHLKRAVNLGRIGGAA